MGWTRIKLQSCATDGERDIGEGDGIGWEAGGRDQEEDMTGIQGRDQGRNGGEEEVSNRIRGIRESRVSDGHVSGHVNK